MVERERVIAGTKLMKDDNFDIFCIVTSWRSEQCVANVTNNGYLDSVKQQLQPLLEEQIQRRNV